MTTEVHPDEDFRRFLSEGHFNIQRSAEGRYTFYPRVAEPGTGAALEWVEASGCGTVYATTVVRKKPPEPSYNVALVDLEEGVRMMSRVEGIGPEEVAIGMAVRAKIVEQDGEPTVVFFPAEG
ncbi:MAG: Zn-ribbon domain-containing OB-fold protein [Rhizomicrobium sp.]